MDNTLESVGPLYNENPQDEMSYLFGRDPSILAYGHRPCPLKDNKKNLLPFYETEESSDAQETTSNSDLQILPTVKVYLRMKPFPRKIKLSSEQQDAYKILNSTTLFTRLPTLDTNTSCLKRSNSTDIVCRKFTFTKTFGPETTQLELFEQSVKQQMIDFLSGQNSTIMTYGTTNSGKSYTLQGTITSPGIIPRCLEFVFSNITPKPSPSYKPINHCDVITLDPLDRAQELEIKTKLLTFASVDKYQYINAYKEMQKLLQEESPIRPSQCIDAHYSVWVSFAEIYNEIVYDLLSNECQKKRTALKLATDSQGRAFIKGLKTICVNSGSEAYQVLMAGQYNLKVAATALNARSSRSHCIFTIKLLKYYVENNPNSVEVSTFAFCDLAGSERLKKTLNIGDRLKEAQNINTSLLVLGRCLKTIHEGQLTKHKMEHIGPFRESKLTRLFQKALSGKEHIALIVNINPIPNLYIETQNVLNFSAIAKKIVIEKEKVQKKNKSRFSQIVTQSTKTVTDWDATELESSEWHSVDVIEENEYDQEDYDELVNENERLKKEIIALKNSALSRDIQIREEMAEQYKVILKDVEAGWKEHIKLVEEQQEDILQMSIKQVEDFYKEKLDKINSRKRRRSSHSLNYEDDNFQNIQELEIENSRLTSKIVDLKSRVKELRERNQHLTVEKNKATFELGLTKEELQATKTLLSATRQDNCSDKDAKYYMIEIESQLHAKQEQVKKLKEFLNEAKEEYIAITTEMAEKEHIIKKKEEKLVEKQEMIEDLEEELADINVCLIEKTKAADMFEEKLDNQTKILIAHENKIQDMQAQINTLESEKASLLHELEVVKNTECGHFCESLKDPNLEVTVEESSPDVNVERVTEVSTENKDTQTEHEFEAETKAKIIAIEGENSALKEKLGRSTVEIQSLKDELESAKVTLKDISEQISNLQTRNMQPNAENDEATEQQPAVQTVEIGCQAQIDMSEIFEGQSTETSKNDVFDKSSQTIETLTKEETNQTSFIEETDGHDIVLDELAELTVKYDDIKTKYNNIRAKYDDIKTKYHNQTSSLEKSDGEESFLDELAELTVKYDDVKAKYDDIRVKYNDIQAKYDDIKTKYDDINAHYDDIKIKYEEKCSKLNTLQAEFDANLSKCEVEHKETICNLRKELSSAIEKCNIKSQCLDVHVAKVQELEHNLDSVKGLETIINELNKKLETCQAEKDKLQQLFNENCDKILELEDRLELAAETEREKDAEINSIQKEMKHMIQMNKNNEQSDILMETEMKNTIRDLTSTKQMLSQKQEYIQELEMRIKHHEQNTKILDLLQQSAHERQAENERLRIMNEELKNSLIEKEREMESFMKNRDNMVTKYESLVKAQQEELEKHKQELIKHHSKEINHCENTSEDEVVPKSRRGRRQVKKSPKHDDVSIIELSGSESKRTGKRTYLAPPELSSTKKKNTRTKKKLYTTEDDSFQDIESLEVRNVTPATQARSLRSRRK
ncbi:uncharacterized protein LOC143429158 [Xylocopa sonorina]|uniref:uncharacterized protein LOC143429158 n=1 Tax=Xylocopa sonorina TaxID=1818115 RepID=UPI00403A8C6F